MTQPQTAAEAVHTIMPVIRTSRLANGALPSDLVFSETRLPVWLVARLHVVGG